MVWLLGIPTDRKSFPQVAGNACSDRLLTVSTLSKDNDAKKYQVELEARGICLYVFFLFVCLLLCSALFCFPSFLPSLFFVTDFFSVLPSGTKSYSLLFSAEKNG